MILIVESGATKTAWRSVSDDGIVYRTQTAGLSPTCLDHVLMNGIVKEAVPVVNPEGRNVEKVFFYGAGLVSEEAVAPIADVFGLWCPFAEVEFHSDLLSAARSLFGDGSGIVAIMGTGSNSCLYENGKIVKNIRPGGYVLGDEGSGVALGRAFLADYVKGLLPERIESAFVAEFGLGYPEIVRRVYKEPAASAFMASFAPFILSHSDDEHVSALIDDCLESFVRRSLSRYRAFAEDSGAALDVGVVGSFGCACEERLRKIGEKYGITFVRFLKSPIDELVKYHGI